MEYIKVILPSLCVGLIFWYVLRAIIKADGSERKAMDKYYAELDKTRRVDDSKARKSGDSAVEQTQTEKEGAHGTGNEAGPH